IQYWFDQHDDDNERYFVELPFATDLDITLEDIPTASLNNGPHRLHYRLLDHNARWSGVLYRNFTVQHPAPLLVQLRYWTKEEEVDPADMHYVPIDPQVQNLDLTTAIAFCASSLPPGERDVFFQIQENHGFWSAVVKDTVDVDAASTEPTVSIMQAPPDAVEPNMEYTYTATSPTAIEFVWTFPAGWTIMSQSGNTIVAQSPSSPESGSVECTAADVCGGTALGTWLLSNVGVESTGQPGSATLVPNPTSGSFSVQGYDQAITRLTIHNATGQLVQDFRPAQTDRLTLDLSNEANGLYTVRILQGDQHTKLQVMVQH
ncbi:MAG TPA: T9SS type A sorting domain-containing protein, partial [Flavobacteriales bacterium]|nr:T9SS type A sorting domain-containing protein [Flavobacteriales bacterium]